MQHLELELEVGDSVRVGDHWLTVVEFDGDEVLFQLSDSEHYDPESSFEPLPR